MSRPLWTIAIAILSASAGCAATDTAANAHADDRATSHRSFADVEHWQRVFDDPARAQWQRPDEVVRALRLKQGMAVADLGAGTGYFLPHLARTVGPGGAVFAIEPEVNLVAHIRDRAEEEKLSQVTPILASKDNPRLPVRSVDLILIVNTFHHIDHRRRYLESLRSALVSLGRIAVIDWKKEELPEGPPLGHKLPSGKVIAEMEDAGFALLESPSFLPYQYFLIFRKAEATTSPAAAN